MGNNSTHNQVSYQEAWAVIVIVPSMAIITTPDMGAAWAVLHQSATGLPIHPNKLVMAVVSNKDTLFPKHIPTSVTHKQQTLEWDMAEEWLEVECLTVANLVWEGTNNR